VIHVNKIRIELFLKPISARNYLNMLVLGDLNRRIGLFGCGSPLYLGYQVSLLKILA
jgi:hypothetical protein